MKGKSLLLKTPIISDTGLERIKLHMTQKPPPYRLTFIVPEIAMQIMEDGKQSIVRSTLGCHPDWCIVQPSSEKFLPAVNVNGHKDP